MTLKFSPLTAADVKLLETPDEELRMTKEITRWQHFLMDKMQAMLPVGTQSASASVQCQPYGEVYVLASDHDAEIEQLRGNLSLAEEGLANYALEVERLQKRLDRINEKWPHVTEVERLRDALKRVRRVAAEGTTHTGMIAALGILVDRSLNPGNGPLPPDYTYHSHEPEVGDSFPEKP